MIGKYTRLYRFVLCYDRKRETLDFFLPQAKYKQLLLSLGNVRNYRLIASVLAGTTTPIDLATKVRVNGALQCSVGVVHLANTAGLLYTKYRSTHAVDNLFRWWDVSGAGVRLY